MAGPGGASMDTTAIHPLPNYEDSATG
jgi:hypothetical protein